MCNTRLQILANLNRIGVCTFIHTSVKFNITIFIQAVNVELTNPFRLYYVDGQVFVFTCSVHMLDDSA